MIKNCKGSSLNELWPCFSYADQTFEAIADVIRTSLLWKPLNASNAPSLFKSLIIIKQRLFLNFKIFNISMLVLATYNVFSTPPVLAWDKTFVKTFGLSIVL